MKKTICFALVLLASLQTHAITNARNNSAAVAGSFYVPMKEPSWISQYKPDKLLAKSQYMLISEDAGNVIEVRLCDENAAFYRRVCVPTYHEQFIRSLDGIYRPNQPSRDSLEFVKDSQSGETSVIYSFSVPGQRVKLQKVDELQLEE